MTEYDAIWWQRFPTLAGADDSATRRLRERVKLVTVPAGQTVFHAGGPCEAYSATGVTDTEVQAFAIPKPEFDQAMDASAAFRRFVFANLGGRLAEVIERVEEVALQPLDRRLAALLLARAEVGHMAATHQQIAAELGSAREVISRHLKRLEGRGLVRLGRSSVELINREGLRALAGERV
ncbi:MAG: Crp/Fnr family transcriptional regulator [Gammaproteobacteria bacterium]|nr:Crp/Fnr family transcriptional regulator [Gammaproteobacteria bacterium]NIR28452.1 Crp/Fnr family transcriptional regulator [Gammaproteobacteria bacterium]NIR96898.1 Crp/Fnr family transcriptional regulator [Gammaproteobacteria bacterium]NIT62599.1 Crp/Fnr family transcriptional regulator [Gammaproteobacteria bacterium]NIV19556.1 helix-turn-helix domain-containing protein [Gammaproteobacteria bacterium]